MKDLKVYYKTEYPGGSVNSAFDKEIEKVAKKFGLSFQGSGFEFGERKRDLHYKREKK